MTLEEQYQYYADLLIIQYRGKAKAQAMIQAIARQALCDNLPLAVQDAFDIETAIGAQLDILGKYAGVVRDVLTFTGGATLDDDDFRSLIKIALSRNSNKGSLLDIETLLSTYFGNAIQVFDHKDMTLGYFFNASIGSLTLLEAFVRLDYLPRPLGVALSSLIYAVGLDDYFAFSSAYQAWPSGVTGFQSAYGPNSDYFTGNTHSGTKVVDAIADTSGLTAGNPIAGNGLAVDNYIDTIDSGVQIHVLVNSTSTVVAATLVTQPLAPWINIEDIITF